MTSADLTAFLPTSRAEMVARGWDQLDVLFVSGDAYVDHPAFGVPLLARLLEATGYRVGILAQPDWRRPEALRIMGRPRLCACVAAGAMDSMVNRYTAAKKVRNDDAYSPGGRAGLRPDRASIAYTAAVKAAFKGLPVILGGIEASLRRLAHYDYWDDRVRRSILTDSKADLLVYGMAEHTLPAVLRQLAAGATLAELPDIPGTAVQRKTPPPQALLLPAFEQVRDDKRAYGEAFRLAADEALRPEPRPLAQAHGDRFVVVQPPPAPLTEAELDRVYALPFRRLPHPSYSEPIPAFEQIKWSITTHRGCYGGCAFCAITAHQGKTIQSRSPASIRQEVEALTRAPHFRGTVSDLGGPTANMYGTGCGRPAGRACRRPSCLFPEICPHLRSDDRPAVELLRAVRRLPGVKHAFVASGLRMDLLERQPRYFEELVRHHTGGLLKVAPETTVAGVARVMRKPGPASFLAFLRWYHAQNRRLGQKRGVVPYLIAGHPGCTLADMVEVALFLREQGLRVEQVQEFTPTPGTLATCLWHTGCDPYTGEPVHVPRDPRERRLQKALLLYHRPENRADLLTALRRTGRSDLAPRLLGGGGPRRRHPGPFR